MQLGPPLDQQEQEQHTRMVCIAVKWFKKRCSHSPFKSETSAFTLAAQLAREHRWSPACFSIWCPWGCLYRPRWDCRNLLIGFFSFLDVVGRFDVWKCLWIPRSPNSVARKLCQMSMHAWDDDLYFFVDWVSLCDKWMPFIDPKRKKRKKNSFLGCSR